MKSKVFSDFKMLPSVAGTFNLLDARGRSLFAAVAENIKADAAKLVKNYEILNRQIAKIEVFDCADLDLIAVFSRVIRQKKTVYNFSLNEQNLYPHLKLTSEKFPRLLATRRIEDDAAEYFGAFLPATSVRFLLGFLIDRFNLRGCDIPINGNLPVPCPQFYRRKCLAPCVENLCEYEKYHESVNLVRLFLKDERETLNKIFSEKIEKHSDVLEFETAAQLHRLSTELEDFRSGKDGQFSLDDAADLFEIKQGETGFLIYAATRRKRRILGRRVFVCENKAGFSAKVVLEQMLWQFYQFHTPKEISVSIDFPTRKLLEKTLSSRSGRTVKIQTVKKEKQTKTASRAFRRAAVEFALENLKPKMPLIEILACLQKEFSLAKIPSRIEAYDVAHISGTDFVGAKSVWQSGKFLADQYEFRFSDCESELDALSEIVESSFENAVEPPDLIVIDGGKAQLARAIKAVNKFPQSPPPAIVSAVKPPQLHNDISHFLLENENPVKYRDFEPFRVLLQLRDEAHRLANYVHRTKRETAHFYEIYHALPFLPEKERYFLLRRFRSLAELKNTPKNALIECLGEQKGTLVYRELKKESVAGEPFIVPVRYDEPNGAAEDLQPLFAVGKSRN